MADVRVHLATAERWPDVETVIGERGDPAWCWCQYFRAATPKDRLASRARNRAALRIQVCSDPLPPGVLGYADDEPVGWCGTAPFSSYARMPRVRVAQAARTAGEDPRPALVGQLLRRQGRIATTRGGAGAARRGGAAGA